ncbi:hypothetical protein glysoja_038911 [Glycine soja]|uniref:Uncharacterized protein n=1 Tax=Glycine soja TaxID=3848 RepID=A0A0B2R9K5_GLYSO|nr:hypothetical protein glysoja_038911 [Glycine soja]
MSAFPFHDNHHRKLLVGSIGLSVSITMYGSLLIVMGHGGKGGVASKNNKFAT